MKNDYDKAMALIFKVIDVIVERDLNPKEFEDARLLVLINNYLKGAIDEHKKGNAKRPGGVDYTMNSTQ